MLLSILNIIGSLALFIFGMKIMSDAMQRVSNINIRRRLNRMTKNPLSSVFSGIMITSGVQSSSAFSVLLLGFVNAKTINLKKAFALMIGANIGTTTTLWLLNTSVSWGVEYLALPLIAVALPIYLSKNQRRKNWAQIVIGFALIFVALYFLKFYVPDEKSIFEFFNPNTKLNYFYCLVFLLLGMLVTIIVQSSSATTFLILGSMSSLNLPLELGFMMIIGANIGTTTTVHIASSVGNIASKSVAVFHTLFNVIGAILFFFLVFPFVQFLLDNFSFENGIYLAIFHTTFNVIVGFIFLISLNFWVYIFTKFNHRFKSTKSKVIYSSPEMYLFDANREVLKFIGITKQTINTLGRLITESNDEKFNELKERTFFLEKQGDEVEQAVLSQLRKVYDFETSGETSKRVHNLMDVCYHLESVGDLAIKTADIHLKRRASNSYITPKLRSLLIEMHETLSFATTILIQNLNEQPDAIDLAEAKKVEREINRHYEESHQSLLRALEKEKIPMLSILYYQELIQNYEIIGDHLYKANEALKS